jgi:alpha-tubulin suppressor-like RCC1 family protein
LAILASLALTQIACTRTPSHVQVPRHVQVAVGVNQGCAVRPDGSLWCWGWNDQGRIGDGTTETRLAPVQVTTLGNNVRSVIIGTNTVATTDDGTTSCWGGNSGPAECNLVTSPVGVQGGNGTKEVHGNVCGLRNDGSVWCENAGGTLSTVPFPSRVVKLAAGDGWFFDGKVCGLLSDGTVMGAGTDGRNPWGSPVQVSELDGPALDVFVSEGAACARTASSLWCWGDGIDGYESPYGAFNNVPPTRFDQFADATAAVAFPGPAVDLATDYNYFCAGLEDDTVWCLGDNDLGTLGDGTIASSTTPVKVLLP